MDYIELGLKMLGGLHRRLASDDEICLQRSIGCFGLFFRTDNLHRVCFLLCVCVCVCVLISFYCLNGLILQAMPPIHIQISGSKWNCLFLSVSNIESIIYHVCGLDHFFCKESSRQSRSGGLPRTHFVCGSPDHLNAPSPPTPPVPPAAGASSSSSSSACRQS